MRKIVSNFFIALDGVVEAPDKWHFPYFDDAMGAVVGRGFDSTDALLLGRKGYDEWAAYWPSQPGDDPFASFLNSVDKYVVSNTLSQADWNNTTVIPGASAAEQVAELKQRDGADISMSGSAVLVRWLLAEGLLDELRLLVHPIAVGSGQRLFEETPTHPLKLAESETFDSGVLNLTYTPA